MSSPSAFRIPDLWSYCPFPAIFHENGDAIATESEHWLLAHCTNITPGLRREVPHLMSGQLAAFCYNNCNDERFRVVCDFMITLFLLDDVSDEFKTKDTEILMDIIMNAMKEPGVYRPGATNDQKHPAEEPDASKLTRE